MEIRKVLLFLTLFIGFTYVHTKFIMPQFMPPPQPVAENDGDEDEDTDGEDPDGEGEADADAGQGGEAEGQDDGKDNPPETVIPGHDELTATLGSLKPEDGFLLSAELSTQGASISAVHLADPRFKELNDLEQQVKVLGNNVTTDRTFTTAFKAIDEQLKDADLSLETINWKIESSSPTEVVFSILAPDKSLKLTKTYRLKPIETGEISEATRADQSAYVIEMDFTVINLSADTQVVSYELQGPVGVLLENREHTRKYRDIKLEFNSDSDGITLTPGDLEDLQDEHRDAALENGQKLTERQVVDLVRQKDGWTEDIRYAGIDVQSFAALVSPVRAAGEEDWVDRAYPVMIMQNDSDVRLSDVSVRMVTQKAELRAKGKKNDSVTHTWQLFVGPKYATLLDPPPLEAQQVLDIGTGFFSFFGLTGLIARGMHFLLGTFHGWGIPYGLCIIMLTVLVRSCLLPISRKQAISAAKMKALQPKLNDLKAKYGDDKQKMAQAQFELWRKYDIKPLAGCLPVLLQMPIFIGLYQCLNSAVDLRLAQFLWIENLAAPDAVFDFPIPMPAIVGPHVNILPLVTVVLFLTQQKLFMPPPADEQAEMTQKMMNMMTLMFGALFWHQPAGLCVYFICSSLWGIAERKLLAGTDVKLEEVTVAPAKGGSGGGASSSKEDGNGEPPKKGFFARMAEMAEEAQKQAARAEKERKKKNKRK
ncbi:MAG TPA: hypothetical protein DCG12_08890 [Planctomycetaceae bacterium]|nr:hypothetical protein [Planctomycetaceae bacterium]